MKKTVFILGIAVAIVAALGVMGFSYASASGVGNVVQDAISGAGFGHRGGFGEARGEHFLHPYVEEAVAGILGLSVEDLQSAKEEGARMDELLDDAGLTAEAFQAAMEAALPGIVDAALADEVITQEQADAILERGLRPAGKGPGGFGPLADYIKAAVADILGISVEDLDAAREDGVRMEELLDDAGLTQDEFKAAMEAALPGIVEQAVEDGVITQDQADEILEKGLCGPGKGHGRKGPGRGLHGGGFPGQGFGPGAPEAPEAPAESG